MKIGVFIANALIQTLAAVFGLFILLLSLNGYSEHQATAGLIFYIVLAIISALLLGALSFFASQQLLTKTSLGKLSASLIAVLLSAVIGFIFLIVGFFAAILLTEAMRK